MKIGLELSMLLSLDGDKCDIKSLLNRNVSAFDFNSERLRFTLKSSRLTDFCSSSLVFQYLEYLLALLRIKQLDLVLYNGTIDMQNALAHNGADFAAYATYMNEKTIVTSPNLRENITFVAPFEQDSICLAQSINVILKQIVTFDDRFWIAPYSAACWIIIASLLTLQVFFSLQPRRQQNRFYNSAIAHFDASIWVILAGFATFIYLPQLRFDTTATQEYKIPYKTAYSFADAIMHGEAKAALLNNTFAFRALSKNNTEMYSSFDDYYGFIYLAQALRKNPSKVIVYESVDQACHEIFGQDINTFALVDDFIMKLCNATVVNRLQIKCFDDAPTTQIALLFSANSQYRENVSRLAEFIRIHQLRYLLEDGKIYAPEIPSAYVRHGISITSLQLLFIAYFAFLALGLLGCILEIIISEKLNALKATEHILTS